MKLKYLMMAVASLGLFASCESDDPSLVVAEYHTPTTFVLNTPQFANGIYDLATAEKINFTFSQPDYGYAAACDYTVEVSGTEDFASSATVTTVFHECDIDVDAEEFAVAVCTSMGWLSESDITNALAATGYVPVYVRVNSILTSGVESSAITSNSIQINTIPYFALPAMEEPTAVYMRTDSEWANASEMIPIHSNSDKFWIIRYVEAGASVGFNITNSDSDYKATATNATFDSTFGSVALAIDDAGNVTVSESGWYIFGVSVVIDERHYDYSINVFEPNVYIYGTTTGLGDNGWTDMDEWKFSVPEGSDGYFVSPALATTGELRMCVHPIDASGSAWAGDWWHTEFVFYDEGEIVYRGTGDDQTRYTVSAGLQVYLNFVTGEAKAE